LLHFKKERSPGPDGWTTEFFSHFFDIVGPDLLSMVEDVRIRGKISKSINSTFLVMIPKKNNAVSFNDYRPISLCNLIYELVSKVIANRLKPFLEKGLSAEQLGFLKGRRIQDAIATAHECIHSIKQKNLKALIMKIDLKKAFDCIDWDFLRLILLAAGFGDRFTDWILACVTSANFAVLVNGKRQFSSTVKEGFDRAAPFPHTSLFL
jgi:mannosylglycoprotein endo-beta-mannosidase